MAGDHSFIPKNYDQLYRHYIKGDGAGGSLCKGIIRKMMRYATQDEVEILSQEVALRCVEKDVLSIFDPSKANFGGVIFFVTRTVVVKHLSKKSRNPITGLCGGYLRDGDEADGEFEPGIYYLDKLFRPEDSIKEDNLSLAGNLEILFEECRFLLVTPRHKRDQNLLPLLLMMAKQCDPQECSDQLGVTPSTIHNWIRELRRMYLELTTPRQKSTPKGEIPGWDFSLKVVDI